MVTATESKLRNALKFETTGEVDSQEGVALAGGLLVVPPNCSEVGEPQVELDGAMGKALITKPPPQYQQTKLIFNVDIDYPFLD